jgi:hypothetical protein
MRLCWTCTVLTLQKFASRDIELILVCVFALYFLLKALSSQAKIFGSYRSAKNIIVYLPLISHPSRFIQLELGINPCMLAMIRHCRFLARFGLCRSFAKNLNFCGPGDLKLACPFLRIFCQNAISQISSHWLKDFPLLKVENEKRGGSGRRQ